MTDPVRFSYNRNKSGRGRAGCPFPESSMSMEGYAFFIAGKWGDFM